MIRTFSLISFLLSIFFLFACSNSQIKKENITSTEKRIVSSDGTEIVRPIEKWHFSVLSDIHLHLKKGNDDRNFQRVIEAVIKDNPKFVVLNGDSTNGNVTDKYNPDKASAWWQNVESAIEPLWNAGIPVFVIAGNHDFYLKFQQDAFRDFWEKSIDKAGEINKDFNVKRNNNDLDYEVFYKNVRLEFLHLPFPDNKAKSSANSWIANVVSSRDQKPKNEFRFAFGHIPFFSVFSAGVFKSSQQIVTTLIDKGVDAYFAGHEHFVYDINLPLGKHENVLRHITVGSASGSTLDAPIRSEILKQCEMKREIICTTPTGNLKYELSRIYKRNKETGKKYSPGYEQKTHLGFVSVEVANDKYNVLFQTLDSEKDSIISFR